MDKEFGIKEMIELKHKNSIEMIQLKDKIEDKRHDKKKEFATFLYDLKDEYMEKQNKFAIERLKYADYLRRKKK